MCLYIYIYIYVIGVLGPQSIGIHQMAMWTPDGLGWGGYLRFTWDVRGVEIQYLEFPWGLGFRVQGSGFRVQGLGFRVQGLGFRV